MSKHNVVVVSPGYESYETEREILQAVDAELVLAPRDCSRSMLSIPTP